MDELKLDYSLIFIYKNHHVFRHDFSSFDNLIDFLSNVYLCSDLDKLEILFKH